MIYLDSNNASKIIISDEMITRHYDFDYMEHKDSLASFYKIVNDTLMNMKENYYWTSWLCYQDNFNEPLYTLDEYKNEINSFTIEELKTAAKYMKHDNYLRFILMPGSDKKE